MRYEKIRKYRKGLKAVRWMKKLFRRLGRLLKKLKPSFIKRLDWYIIRKFIGTYVFSILLIMAIAIVFDVNQNLSKFIQYHAPLKARNLSGRTGRGDTTFAGYLTERLDHEIPETLEFAAALVSLKMETPGPFRGTREDVLDYLEKFY